MKEGASTITQQLARNINELGIGREKRLRRKVAEAILAMKIEQSFSKDEILELYLNQIYYGKGAYGCEAAAKYYFNKSAKDLDLAEAALLAGIPQRPNKFSKDMDAAYKRRDWVLQRMLETGKITPGQRDTARAEQLKLTRKAPKGTTINGSPEVAYFVNYVMQQLVAEYGADEVYRGWKIYTTLHPDIQRAAEESLKYGVHHYDEAANQGALISLDPKSGAIRAMVGGLNYNKVQFNIITQGLRQPGSCFKPFVYAAAFDTDKADLDTRFTDDPDLSPHKTEDGWKPKNYSGKYSHRSMSVREAFRNSTNTVAVKVALDTGLETVINYAHRMGISTKIPPYAPIALGAAGVRPMELCSAYSVFENGGKRSIPYGIKKVLDGRGEVVVDNNPKAEDTQLRDTTITEVNEGLSEVVKHGSGAEAASVPNAHGKTGTTSDNRDAWFAGSTPELTTVIWVGHENRDSKGKLNKKHPYLEMPGATGGHLCAPIWRDFMLKAVPIQQAAIANANRLNNIRPPVVERDNPESGDVPPPNPNPKKQPIVKTVVPTNDGTTDPT
ncbi:MAG: transglycosylase domain-containing protein, partial [Chthonomonadales bacterium]